MKLMSPVICGSCGAELLPAAQTGTIVCEFCGTPAEVPTPPADRAAGIQEDLKHVDEWWERQRRPLMTQDRRGQLHPPEEQHVHHIVLMAVGGILGLISAVAGHSLDWDLAGIAGFFLFPILISLPAALLHERAERRYKEYKKLETEYEGRRSAILESHARRA